MHKMIKAYVRSFGPEYEYVGRKVYRDRIRQRNIRINRESKVISDYLKSKRGAK